MATLKDIKDKVVIEYKVYDKKIYNIIYKHKYSNIDDQDWFYYLVSNNNHKQQITVLQKMHFYNNKENLLIALFYGIYLKNI